MRQDLVHNAIYSKLFALLDFLTPLLMKSYNQVLQLDRYF